MPKFFVDEANGRAVFPINEVFNTIIGEDVFLWVVAVEMVAGSALVDLYF